MQMCTCEGDADIERTTVKFLPSDQSSALLCNDRTRNTFFLLSLPWTGWVGHTILGAGFMKWPGNDVTAFEPTRTRRRPVSMVARGKRTCVSAWCALLVACGAYGSPARYPPFTVPRGWCAQCVWIYVRSTSCNDVWRAPLTMPMFTVCNCFITDIHCCQRLCSLFIVYVATWTRRTENLVLI